MTSEEPKADTPQSNRPATLCEMPLAQSNRISTAAKALDTDSTTGLVRMVACSEAEMVLSYVARRDRKPDPVEATLAAQDLIGFYPAREVVDAKRYVAGMTALMAAYPLDFVRRVTNPVTGLPSRLKYLPTLADVREALEVERARRDRIVANARYVIEETQRRKQADEDAREFERNRPDAEARARQVKEAIEKVVHASGEIG